MTGCNHLQVDEQAVIGPMHVGQEPAVLVAGLVVSAELHNRADGQQLGCVRRCLTTKAFRRARASDLLWGIDAKQTNGLLLVCDNHNHRVAVDYPLDPCLDNRCSVLDRGPT